MMMNIFLIILTTIYYHSAGLSSQKLDDFSLIYKISEIDQNSYGGLDCTIESTTYLKIDNSNWESNFVDIFIDSIEIFSFINEMEDGYYNTNTTQNPSNPMFVPIMNVDHGLFRVKFDDCFNITSIEKHVDYKNYRPDVEEYPVEGRIRYLMNFLFVQLCDTSITSWTINSDYYPTKKHYQIISENTSEYIVSMSATFHANDTIIFNKEDIHDLYIDLPEDTYFKVNTTGLFVFSIDKKTNLSNKTSGQFISSGCSEEINGDRKFIKGMTTTKILVERIF
jgi:hypothetical protein